MYPYMYQGDSLTIHIEGRPHTINRETHPNYNKIIDAIRDEDWDSIPDLVDMTRAIANYTSGNGDIEVRNGDVYFDGRPFANALTDRLLGMLEEGFPVDPLCNFISNIKQNPSKRAVDELYGFLEKNSLPITPDGHFLAYKKVRDNFKDIHSGTFDNSVGSVCEMPRNEVDEDKDRTCSSGLHFCSLEYLPSFGYGSDNRVVIVKINPADVVSIPSDYNNAKGRTCRYEVVDEHGAENRDYEEAFDSIVVGDYDDEYGLDDEFFDLEDIFSDLEDSKRPREVYLDIDNRPRYADNGQYAPKQAYAEYEAWVDREHPASVTFNEVREVYIGHDGNYRYTDDGRFASREAFLAWQDYLDEND